MEDAAKRRAGFVLETYASSSETDTWNAEIVQRVALLLLQDNFLIANMRNLRGNLWFLPKDIHDKQYGYEDTNYYWRHHK